MGRAGALFQHGIKKWHKLGRKRKLTILPSPSKIENIYPPFAHRHFNDGWISTIEFCQHMRSGDRARIESVIFPKMNFCEIAETWIGKRREKRVAKINFCQQRVTIQAPWLDFYPVDP